MDLIKLTSSTAFSTELSAGEPINGYDSALWVERYQGHGEFKITGKLSSGLKEFLPIGTFITQIRSQELMRVENQVIDEPKDEDPTIEITGRSFTSYLEQRLIAQNYVDVVGNAVYDYILTDTPTWEQIVYLIFDHLLDNSYIDADDQVVGIQATHSCSGPSTSEERHVKYGTVWARISELLKVDDLGIRCLRPTPTEPDIIFNVYQGEDKTDSVRFSTIIGDLDSVAYLFSNKKLKNGAHVVGRWVQEKVNVGTAVGVDRQYMYVDASDLDQQYTAMPTGGTLTAIINAMVIRGQEALKEMRSVTITQADISPNSKLRYRSDYNLGDLVIVDGNFNQSQVMRVSEFAEIEDENGSSGQPTLEVPGED